MISNFYDGKNYRVGLVEVDRPYLLAGIVADNLQVFWLCKLQGGV